MKRIIGVICVWAMLLSLAGCKNVSENKSTTKAKLEKPITLFINENKINLKKNEIYFSKNKVLMLPLEVIKDDLDIAVNEFNSNKIVVEKSDSKVAIKVNSDKVEIGDAEYEIGDKVLRKRKVTYVPVNLFTNYLRFSESYDKKTRTVTITDITRGNDLPSRYSYVDEGRMPEIKDQGNSGYCWAYASLSAIESTLLPAVSTEFETKNLTEYAKQYYDVSQGGNYSMTLAYLLSDKGPRDAKTGEVKWHLRSAQMFEGKNVKRIKQLVFKYGGVETSMFLDKRVQEDKKHYNMDTSAYYSDVKNNPNHDVVVVGWDDDYSKDNFATKPEKDGAFICQNSWGEAFGDKGVFYVSYEEATIGADNICYTKLDEINYNVYEADEFGMNTKMSLNNENKAYFANVYTANADEKLHAVGFYATADNVDYEVYIVRDFAGEKSLNNLGKKVGDGSFKYKGFYTVELDKDIDLAAGEEFAVAVKVSCSGDTDLVPLESQAKGGKIDIKVNDNMGYYSAYGDFWKRAEKDGRNVCLKAYTLSD